MQVSDILRGQDRRVETIPSTKSVLEAVHRLNEHGIGSLLVTGENDRIIGILTERDVLRLSGDRSEKLASITVAEAMTKELVTGGPEDRITELLNVMTQRRVRHLPIMKDEKLIGLVSIGDLVKAQLEQTAAENQQLKNYIQGG